MILSGNCKVDTDLVHQTKSGLVFLDLFEWVQEFSNILKV